MRFAAVALSVDLVASDAILRLNALYAFEGTLLFLDRSGTNRRVRKVSTVPVMVERGNVALLPSLSPDRTVGTGLRYRMAPNPQNKGSSFLLVDALV